MNKVKIYEETTKNPLQLMGQCAGACWGADTSDVEKNIARGRDCIASGHNRVMEYPQVYLELDGYSARVMRELYTHIAGGPTRLQASTRYIEYGEFEYIIPPKIYNHVDAFDEYIDIMNKISDSYKRLEDMGISKEDIANILPLGMTTKVVLRTNLRNLVDMSHQRKCSRAYWEFRELFQDIECALDNYSPEWSELTKLFKPKCELTGYCTEKYSCGRKPKKQD